MKNSENKHIIACIALCVIGVVVLALVAPVQGGLYVSARQIIVGGFGECMFFGGGFYAFIRILKLNNIPK